MSHVFMFPGQGAQRAGMGRAVAEAYPDIAGAVFRLADEILGFSISTLCFEGPDAALAQTEITQPALFTTCVAILRVLESKDVRPSACAGHSVGEYAALVAAGSVSFEETLPIVRRRGELMTQAVAHTPGAMAAVLGLNIDAVTEACRDASNLGVVEPSNLNSPSQIVISGEEPAVLQAMELLKERGGKAVRLNVSAPFHCSLMAPVAEALAPDIQAMAVAPPSVPVIANATAKPESSAVEVRDNLIRQIESPVRWSETMAYLTGASFTSCLEIGPGKVLSGLFRSFDPGVEVRPVSSPDEIEQAVAQ